VLPGLTQHAGLGADHEDDGTHDVLRCSSNGTQGGQGVGHNLVGLGAQVTGTRQRAITPSEH